MGVYVAETEGSPAGLNPPPRGNPRPQPVRNFRRPALSTIASFASIISAGVALTVGAVSIYYTRKALDNLIVQQQRYWEERFARAQGSFSLAWKTIGEANNQPFELGQSKALMYLAESSELPGHVVLNNSSLSFYRNTDTAASRPMYFNLQYSEFCKTKISSGLSEKEAEYVMSFVDLRQAQLSGIFHWADFLGANMEAAVLEGMEAENGRFAATNLDRATLRGGRFRGVDFQGANLRGIKTERGYVGDGASTYGSGFELYTMDQHPAWPLLLDRTIGVTDALRSAGVWELAGEDRKYIVDFTDARFLFADIRGADLRNSNISQTQVNQACADATTILPEGRVINDDTNCLPSETVKQVLRRLTVIREEPSRHADCDIAESNSANTIKTQVAPTLPNADKASR